MKNQWGGMKRDTLENSERSRNKGGNTRRKKRRHHKLNPEGEDGGDLNPSLEHRRPLEKLVGRGELTIKYP